MIIPDGILRYFPFSSLMDGEGKYVAERYAISMAPFLEVYCRLQKRKGNGRGKTMALANTQFQETWKSIRPLATLRNTEREAPNVGKRMEHSVVLVDQAESTFKALPLQEFQIIHFATHSLVGEVKPERSGIVMQPGKEEDGFLQAREICRMKIPASLVVVSGCKSGRGKLVNGEGILGLSHTLFSAGAAGLILSLWDLPDRATADFMDIFYERLTRIPPSRALQESQKAFIGSARWNHPKYCAAFYAEGNVDQIPGFNSQGTAHRLLWIALLVVLLFSVYGFSKNR